MTAHPEIVEAARYVASTQQQLQDASAEYANASAEHTLIEERVIALNVQRDGIISRRQQGDQRPTDAADLALVEADREGLAPILAEAQAAMDAARRPVQEAKRSVDLAKQGLQFVEDRLAMAAMMEHATKLGDLLFATIKQIDELHPRVGGGRVPWAPSKDLYQALLRRASSHGLL